MDSDRDLAAAPSGESLPAGSPSAVSASPRRQRSRRGLPPTQRAGDYPCRFRFGHRNRSPCRIDLVFAAAYQRLAAFPEVLRQELPAHEEQSLPVPCATKDRMHAFLRHPQSDRRSGRQVAIAGQDLRRRCPVLVAGARRPRLEPAATIRGQVRARTDPRLAKARKVPFFQVVARKPGSAGGRPCVRQSATPPVPIDAHAVAICSRRADGVTPPRDDESRSAAPCMARSSPASSSSRAIRGRRTR